MNGRGTWDNVTLVVHSLILLHYQYITGDEVKHAVDAYNLQVRDKEKKTVYLDLNFETIQKALRVSSFDLLLRILDRLKVSRFQKVVIFCLTLLFLLTIAHG